MSDVLRILVHRSTPLLLFLCLPLFASTGCSGTSAGMGQALKNTSPGQSADSSPSNSQIQEDKFLADPLGESGQAGPTGKAHPKSVLKTAFSQVGKPYRYGGSKPETGFDCSGFVKWVYSQYNIGLPRSSGDMMAAGTSVPRNDLKPGDLVFFGKKKRITHVGIYTGDNKYIHSPRTGKSIQESSLDDRSRGEYYAGARRLLKPEGRDNNRNSIWVEQAEREMAVAKASIPSEAAPKAAPIQIAAEVDEPIIVASLSTDMALAATNGEPSAETAAVVEAAVPVAVEAAAPVNDQPKPIQVAEVAVNIEENQPIPISKTPAAAAGAKKHQVTAGDTIYTLARKYGVTREALAKANHLEGEKAALLKLGQTLTIPPAAAKTASGQNLITHKVASGDTLYDLARKYGVSTDALAKANSLEGRKVANLKLGQTLVIPPK